jgi:hypothetical protein
MKYYLFLIFFTFSIIGNAQEIECYSVTIQGTLICNSSYKWNNIKVTAPKEKLLKFLRMNDLLHSCNYTLMSEADISKEFTKADDCNGDIIKIEFKDPKDVLELYKEVKEKKQKESNSKGNNPKDNANKPNENNVTQNELKENEEPPSIQICINSNGEISLGFNNEMGSFEVTSKGKFSISVKGKNDTEYKVGL